MKRDFTQEDFEDFLKRSADSLRMKAPEKIWQNLSRELNNRRRRFIIGLSAFLLITTTAGYFVTTNNSTKANASVQPKEQQTSNLNSSFTRKEQAGTTLPKQINQQSIIEGKQTSRSKKNTDRITEHPLNLIALNNTKSTQTVNTNNIQQVEPSFIENNFNPTVVDSYTEFDEIKKDEKTKLAQKDLTTSPALPMTIESVLNSFKAKNKKAKLEQQFYFAPTISYRKLSENKSYLRTLDAASIPSYFTALHSSVNNEVTHKPDIGFELGFTAKYALSNKLKIRSGIQFNVNRYDVKAFSSPLAIATIALNNGPRADSLSTISGYSNVDGYKSNWLQNFSFQVSVPIGVEYSFKGSDKMQFGIATTVQPTYVLGDRSYLITTDYKSYTQVPWLIRRWNVNTSLETFVKYKNWQFGPQVRYQLLSSFISKYPVKENLFDFGLKVGVTLK